MVKKLLSIPYRETWIMIMLLCWCYRCSAIKEKSGNSFDFSIYLFNDNINLVDVDCGGADHGNCGANDEFQ